MRASMLGMMAAAAAGILLAMPDDAFARGGGAAAGGGVRGATGAARRDGVRTGIIDWRDGTVRGNRALPRRQRGGSFGAIAVDAEPASDGYGPPFGANGFGPGFGPDCQVRRMQFSDEYGWRVRSVVVCP